MPYNYKGDLYKREIVKKLQDMGLDVKSVNALNKIMEKMGLLIHYGNGWAQRMPALSFRCGIKVY